MKIKNFLIFLFLIFLSLKGCKGEEDLITVVNGVVFDEFKNKNLSNAKVLLEGCSFYLHQGTLCGDIIDSTRTDENGKFNFNFVTEKRYTEYRVSIDETEEHTSLTTLGEALIQGGEQNEVTITARELNHLKIHLKLSNQYDPFVLSAKNSRFITEKEFIDTVIYLRVIPGFENQLHYRVWEPGVGSRYKIEVLNIQMDDTTEIYREVKTHELPKN